MSKHITREFNAELIVYGIILAFLGQCIGVYHTAKLTDVNNICI
jgi:hypothetical protein